MNRKVSRPRNGKSKIVIPKNFLPDRDSSNRACWCCTHVGKCLDGYRRCTFKCRRYQFADRKNIKHQHQYTLSRENDPGFPRNFEDINNVGNFTEITDNILHHLGTLAGELDISICKCASNSMLSFIQKILKIGVTIGTTNPNLNIQQLLPSLSQSKINMAMNTAAENREVQLQQQFTQHIKFANIVMDTGTFNRFKVLHFVITNPNYPEYIWAFDNQENTNYSAAEYQIQIQGIIDKLLLYNIEPVAIIADQQTAQVKGICDTIKNHSLGLIKSILHIPCVSHLTNHI